MKIKLYGTGGAVADADSPSFLIDEMILVDAPENIAKKLLRNGYFPKVVCITHFHADHDFGVVMLICQKNWRKKDNFTLIAPKGAGERYRNLLAMTNYGAQSEILPNIIEIDGKIQKEGIGLFGYNIKPQKMDYGSTAKPIDVFGYIITKDSKSAAFSGDAILD